MIEIVITSLFAFISTNLDDIFILMLFFGSKKYKPSHIVIGQYTGILCLVLISYVFAQIGNLIDSRYIGLLGLFPIYLALKQFTKLIRHEADEMDVDLTRTGFIAVAGVTMANGSDNIGVYVPLFSTLQITELLMMILVFIIMTGVWCYTGRYLAYHPIMAKSIARYGHLAMPVVLLVLGLYILFESKVFTLF